MKSGLKVRSWDARIVKNVATYAAMKSGLKEYESNAPRPEMGVATYAAMKSGLKVHFCGENQSPPACSNLCRDEKRTESHRTKAPLSVLG